jgi:hypothetical protein
MSTTPDPHSSKPAQPESSHQPESQSQTEDELSEQMKALARALTVHSLWEQVGLLDKKEKS